MLDEAAIFSANRKKDFSLLVSLLLTCSFGSH